MIRFLSTSTSRPVEWVRSSANIINQVISWVNRQSARKVVAANYTVQDSDRYIGVTATCTITLGTAEEGREVIIKDETGAATVTVSGSIDGAGSKVISGSYGVLRLISIGATWAGI